MAGVDRVAWELAAAQGRVCTRAQLVERGVSPASVSRALRCGVLHPIRAGLYAVGSPAGRHELLAGALLALPGSAVSHVSAAAASGFAVAGDARPHVTVGRGRTHDVPGVVVHETRHLPAADVTTVDGRRCTTPARTLVDLASVLSPRALRHVIEAQLVRAEPSSAELVASFGALARHGRPGIARLRRVLADVLDDEPYPESELELGLLRILVSAGLGGFRRQHRPPWFDGRRGTVDFANVDARLVLEGDGRRWHATTQAFEEDRRRDRLAASHGWRVLRFGWQEVTRRPDEVAAEIRAVLEAPGAPVAHP